MKPPPPIMPSEPSEFSLQEALDLPSDQVEAFLLNGRYDHVGQLSNETTFRGAGIMSRTVLKPWGVKRALALLLDPKNYGGEPMRCFMPRHGFRFTSPSTQVDVLICFECHWIYVFHDSKRQSPALRQACHQDLKFVFEQAFLPIRK